MNSAAFWDAFICKIPIREIEKHKYEIEGTDRIITYLVIFNFFKREWNFLKNTDQNSLSKEQMRKIWENCK